MMINSTEVKKIILKCALYMLCSVIVGTLLLFAVFLLPDDAIKKNVIASEITFEDEGSYPTFVKSHPSIGIGDNFTDCLMLTNAITRNENEPFYKSAMNCTFLSTTQEIVPVRALFYYTEGKSELCALKDYPRYWHGYLVFLRPLLMFFNYAQIRILNGVLLCIVSILSFLCIALRTRLKYAIAFLASLFSLSPIVLPLSMQNSTIFYITNIAVIMLCLLKNKLSRTYIFFYIVGIATSYFDFLTYPSLTLGIPLTLTVIWGDSGKLRSSVIDIIKNSVFWALGYAGMWFCKWVIGSIILNKNIFADAFSSAAKRTGVTSVSVFDSQFIITVFNMVKNTLGYIALPTLLIFCISFALLILCRHQALQRKKQFALYFIVSMLPFIWYLGLREHTFVHSFFTFRSLGTFYFAMFACELSWFDLKPFINKYTSKIPCIIKR
jgi:hypothetical protein